MAHVAVVAEGRREREAVAELRRRDCPAKLASPPYLDDFRGAAAVLGPLHGLPGDALPALAVLAAGTPVIVGLPDVATAAAAARLGLSLHAYARDPVFALANAVPTAEAAIAEAIALAGRTIAGSRCAVLGYGRCGQALADRLLAWHATVRVVARRAEARALAASRGAEPLPWPPGAAALADADFVFNTVPALVLGRSELAALPAGACVLDIASAPGGTDLAAAEALGVGARWLPALPARVLPRTAGRILAEAVLNLLPMAREV